MIASGNAGSRLIDSHYIELSGRSARILAAAVFRPNAHPDRGAIRQAVGHDLKRPAVSFKVLPWHEPISGVALASTVLDVGRGGIVPPM
jgi:hypothetical protein